MGDPPHVDVVIPAFNAESSLARAVDSVFSTGYRALKVIIVEDGSRDGTLAIAEQLCKKYEPNCRLAQHQAE